MNAKTTATKARGYRSLMKNLPGTESEPATPAKTTAAAARGHRRALTNLLIGAVLVGSAACASDPTGTGSHEPPPPATPPATSLTRADLRADGTVTPTADGYTVQGSLQVQNGAEPTMFDDADMQVHFDAAGHVTTITGQAQVPPPQGRISFANPVRADIGFYRGKYLNEQRDLGIKLNDDTDYFVYDIAVALEMRIATGDTGQDAVKPITVRAPLGGRILMVVDYRDPMYYVYGAQDLIGDAGIGWSSNGRIPFSPTHPVAGLGTFAGRNTRVGTFPVLKILSITGQLVDNDYSEVHLLLKDPFSSSLRAGYQAGYNGDMALDLSIKDVVGINIPIAGGSGGIWAEAGTQDVFQGHAYAVGTTSRDASWWPALIPARPVTQLDAAAFVKSDGDFDVNLHGEFGWQIATATHAMSGEFELTPSGLTLAGAIKDGDASFGITGQVGKDSTTVSVRPPQQLADSIGARVNAQLDTAIASAQKAWDDLQQATADYQFELSLRGLRSSIPNMVDVAKKALADGIAAELAKHTGDVYYSQLRSELYAAADRYNADLDRLKAAALDIQDNAETRLALEAALRAAAGRKIFSTTFEYQVLGVVVYTTTVRRQIMSDANAASLLQAADNVKYIKETSDRKISMQQIYDQVPNREIFEDLRDDLKNGVIVMADITDLGFVYGHATKTYAVYAVIGGKRHALGKVDAFSVSALAVAMCDAMIDALRNN
jgi:hypothetical protein